MFLRPIKLLGKALNKWNPREVSISDKKVFSCRMLERAGIDSTTWGKAGHLIEQVNKTYACLSDTSIAIPFNSISSFSMDQRQHDPCIIFVEQN